MSSALVLRFAIYTAIPLALAAAAIVWFLQHNATERPGRRGLPRALDRVHRPARPTPAVRLHVPGDGRAARGPGRDLRPSGPRGGGEHRAGQALEPGWTGDLLQRAPADRHARPGERRGPARVPGRDRARGDPPRSDRRRAGAEGARGLCAGAADRRRPPVGRAGDLRGLRPGRAGDPEQRRAGRDRARPRPPGGLRPALSDPQTGDARDRAPQPAAGGAGRGPAGADDRGRAAPARGGGGQRGHDRRRRPSDLPRRDLRAHRLAGRSCVRRRRRIRRAPLVGGLAQRRPRGLRGCASGPGSRAASSPSAGRCG
jgi:hypothetical protein